MTVQSSILFGNVLIELHVGSGWLNHLSLFAAANTVSDGPAKAANNSSQKQPINLAKAAANKSSQSSSQ